MCLFIYLLHLLSSVEIPLFHVLNARITFGNVNTCSTAEETSPTTSPVASSGEEKDSCSSKFEVDQSVFAIPPSYHIQENGRSMHTRDEEEDEIMQFAIQQSLLESSKSLNVSDVHSNGTVTHQAFDEQYERALQESLLANSRVLQSSSHNCLDPELQFAMELSVKEQQEKESQRQREEAELEWILKLSLEEK